MEKQQTSTSGKIQPVFLLIALFPLGVAGVCISLLTRRQTYTNQPSIKSADPSVSQVPQTCPEALEAARGSIAANGGKVDDFRTGEMRPYATNPFSFNEYATFSLSGSENTPSFMDNGDAQRQITEEILRSCNTTTKVTFAVSQTDYIITWFRMPNGTIQKGVCREPNRNAAYEELPWGEYICV